jgi:hypothetical protein
LSEPVEQVIEMDLEIVAEKESNHVENNSIIEIINANEIYFNQTSPKLSFSSSTTNESTNMATNMASQENDEYLVFNKNSTINNTSFDNLNHEILIVEQSSHHNQFVDDYNLDISEFHSISINVNNVNSQCDSKTNNKIIASKEENNLTNECSNMINYENCPKTFPRSPKSERSRKRKLTHSLSENLKSKSTHVQLAYCTRNKNMNGSRSPIRIVSSTESSNSNISKTREDTNIISDTNIVRIPSLSTIISESEPKSFAENVTSTSNSSSLNENSLILNNKPLLFANNSSRHLKNKSSSMFTGTISTETTV